MKIDYLFVLVCSTLLLTGCNNDDEVRKRDKNEMVIIPMEGWNLTEHKMQSFSANKNIGYVVVPKVWDPNFKIKLRWVWQPEAKTPSSLAIKVNEKDVSLPEYDFYKDFCGLKVFFLETDEVMLKTTCKSPVLLADSYARCERVDLDRTDK